MISAILERVIDRVRGCAERPAASGLSDLLSPAQLDRVIQRERARSDRTGEVFSLATFSVGKGQSDSDTLAHIATYLRRRLRLTDDAGVLEPRKIGVVLPATSASGAWTVVDDVCVCVPAGLPLPKCTVFCYPSDWPAANGDEGSKTSQSGDDTQPARSLEQLFVRPLPLWKRWIDIAGASFGLLLFAPLFAVVAVAIKATSRGPVFFRQRRSGLGGKQFVMLKFRSMIVDAEARKRHLLELNEQDGPAFKIKEDPRITRLGRFLRRTSIDELPQFWNVLRGDMSLVGPRPPLPEEVVQYQTWHRRRLEVTPGLTCIWQVEGRSRVSFEQWMRMDVRYIRSKGLWLDFKLLLKTFLSMVLRMGV